MAKRSSIKTWIFRHRGLTIALVVLIVLGGCLAIKIYLNNKPEKIVADAMSNLIDMTFDDRPTTINTHLSVIGPHQATTLSSNTQLEHGLLVASGIKQTTFSLQALVGETNTNLKGSLINYDDQKIYLRLDNLREALGNLGSQESFTHGLQALEPTIAKIDKRWVIMTVDDLKTVGLITEQQANALGVCQNSLKQFKLLDNQKQLLIDKFNRQKVITSIQPAQPEEINGQSSYHFRLTIDNQALAKLQEQTVTSKQCPIIQSIVDEVSRSSSTMVDMWVDKKTRQPLRLTHNTVENGVTSKLIVNLKYDSPAKISKPNEVISISELKQDIEKILGQDLSQFIKQQSIVR